MLPHSISGNTVVVVIDGIPHTVSAVGDQRHYDEVKSAIKNGEWDRVRTLVLAPTTRVVNQHKKAFGDLGKNVEIKHGEVFYQGYPVRSAVADKILELNDEGFDMRPLVNFLDKVQQNPSIRAREELWSFVESAGFTIDVDGNIVAYKAVTKDYKDPWTGTFDNSVGATPTVPRDEVCADSSRTCAPGLHFATYEYVQSAYLGNPSYRLMLIAVDPADVVSIPESYDGKGRCCRYRVVQEVGNREKVEGKTFDFGTSRPDPVSYHDDDEDYDGEVMFDEEENYDEAEELAEIVRTFRGRMHTVTDTSQKAQAIEAALELTNGVVEGADGAATALGVAGSTFRGWMKKLDIQRPS